ncbi:MAG: MOSC domain-containing protein [Psychromonas sp.]
MNSTVVVVSSSKTHSFSKLNQASINLIEGIGVQGDAHAGKSIKHIYLAKKDPSRPNIRQIHLIQSELFEELAEQGFDVEAGQLGENVTTQGLDLLSLPTGTQLKIGENAVIELTALRNPCVQIHNFKKGLLKAVMGKDDDGKVVRKVGVMGIVAAGGEVKPNDVIEVIFPEQPHSPLQYVW